MNLLLSLYIIFLVFIFKGLHEEGIFRIPGAQEDVECLKTKFNRGCV